MGWYFVLLRDLKTLSFTVERIRDESPQSADFIIKSQKSVPELSLSVEIESQSTIGRERTSLSSEKWNEWALSGNPLTWKIPNFTNMFTVMMDREGALVGSKHGMRNSCVSDIASGDSLPSPFTITGSVRTADKWMYILRLVWGNTWKYQGSLLYHMSFLFTYEP